MSAKSSIRTVFENGIFIIVGIVILGACAKGFDVVQVKGVQMSISNNLQLGGIVAGVLCILRGLFVGASN
jgi:hypothetical protein